MTQWHVPSGRRLVWREWEGEAVVYNAASSRTHYLNPLAAEALARLEEAPHSPAELASDIAAVMDEADAEQLEGQMRRLTAGFAELGLVDPCPD